MKQSIISNNINLEISSSININNSNNLLNGNVFLDNLNESLNKNLSQSVFDLIKCFICLDEVNEPLSCPNCNNYACKKCLETFFRNQNKRCPICKQEVNFNEFKENKIIENIKNILDKDESKKNKIDELSKLIETKKKEWGDQTNIINLILEKIFNYSSLLNDYRKQYELFFLTCQKVVQKTFEDYTKKTQDLIENLLSYNKIAEDTIKKYDEIDKNNKKNYYSNNNIKNLINEILSMERKHFNNKNNQEAEKLLNIPIRLIPSINQYNIKEIKFKKDDFNFLNLNYNGNHYKIGKYNLKYTLNAEKGYRAYCEFSFTLKDGLNACFFITQNKIDKNNKQKPFPMKLTKYQGNMYVYECIITFDEFDTGKEKKIKMDTEVLAFSM